MNIFTLYLIICWCSSVLSRAHGREISFGNSFTSRRTSLMNDFKFRNFKDSLPEDKNDSLIPRKHLFKRNFRVAKKLLEKSVKIENGIGLSPNYGSSDQKRKLLTMKVAKHLVKVTSALQSKPSNAENNTKEKKFGPVNPKFSHLIEIIPINETEHEFEHSELEEIGKEHDLKSAETKNIYDLEKLDPKFNSEINGKNYFASATSSQLESQDLEIKQLKEGGLEILVNPKFNHTINILTKKENKNGGQQSMHTKDIFKINESINSESETVDTATKTENELDSNEDKESGHEFDADKVAKIENEFHIDETTNSNRASFDLDKKATIETNSLKDTDSNLDTETDEALNAAQDTFNTHKDINNENDFNEGNVVSEKDSFDLDEATDSERDFLDSEKATDSEQDADEDSELDTSESHKAINSENALNEDNVISEKDYFDFGETTDLDKTIDSKPDTFSIDEAQNSELEVHEATDSELDTLNNEDPNSEQVAFDLEEATDSKQEAIESDESINLDKTTASKLDTFSIDEATDTEMDVDEATDTKLDIDEATDFEVDTFNNEDPNSEQAAFDLEDDSEQEANEFDESMDLDETTVSKQDTLSIDEATDSELDVDEATDSELDVDEATDSELDVDEVTDFELDVDEVTDFELDVDEVTDSELDVDEVTDSELDTFKDDDQNSKQVPFDLVKPTDSEQDSVDLEEATDFKLAFDQDKSISKKESFDFDEATKSEESIDFDEATDSKQDHFETEEDSNAEKDPFDTHKTINNENDFNENDFNEDEVISEKDSFDMDEAIDSEEEPMDYDEVPNSEQALFDLEESANSKQDSVDSKEGNDFELDFDQDNSISKKESLDFDEATKSKEAIDFDEAMDSKQDHFETEGDSNAETVPFNTHRTTNNENDFNEDEVISETDSFDTDEATDSEEEPIDYDEDPNFEQDTFDINEGQNSEQSTFNTGEVTDSESDTFDFNETPDSEHSIIQTDETSNFEPDNFNPDKVSNSDKETFETVENPNVEPGSFDTDKTINNENINSEKDSFNPNIVINEENNQSIKETNKEIHTEDNQQSAFNDDIEGSGEDSFRSDEFENQTVNNSGRIFSGVFARRNETKSNCKTPKGEPGHCRQITQCLLSDALNSFNVFLQHLCLLRGALVGVCCPDNPVIEITDSEANATNSTETDIKQPPEGCGLNTKTRIVGGTVSLPHEWTWMVALLRRGRFYCGGVIINNWYVLTAAHCVMGMNVKDLSVRLGEYDFNTQKEHQEDISVSDIKRHAQFVTLTFQHDIALLKLKRSINYSKFVGSICLPDDKARDFSDAQGTVVGWGTVSFGGAASPVLRQVTVPVWKNSDCDRVYLLENINESFVCAGSPEKGEDACQGDSGGPLMTVNEQGRWEVIGIVSWGRRCGDPTYPGVYTRVTTYKDWIDENAV